MKPLRKLALLAGATSLVAMGVAAPVSADSGTDDVVVGHLDEFAAGVERGYDISGPVRLSRGEDWTHVRANAKGLDADTTYESHLHAQACADEDGGPHYKDDPEGADTPPNELWLEIATNPSGNGHDASTSDWQVRDGDRSVVIHDGDGARIACADLPVS